MSSGNEAAPKWAAFFYVRKGNAVNDETPLTKWTKGMPSPNPKGRPKLPKATAEVRELARLWDLHINGRIEDGDDDIENWGFNLNG